jgi:LPS-assembly protein
MLRLWFAVMSASIIAAGTAVGEQQSAVRTGGETAVVKQVSGNKAAPMLLQADDLIYDNKNNRVLARGNVEIYYNDYALLADEVVYDRSGNTLTAIGNVRIKEPDGALINGDRITLKDDFRDGFISSLKAVTQDDARFGATNAYRKDGGVTVYENGMFTPCKVCAANPDKAPIWRVKATKITHSKEEQNIYYENAQLEMFGIPVAWVPYFYMPDPTAKRRSGFLMPYFSNSSQLGFTSAVPYYYSISPSADITLTPEITTKAGYLLQAEYRQKLFDGAYKLSLAGVYNDNADDFDGKRQWRGSIQTKGEFGLSSMWRLGWDATLESDDTFRRFYHLDSIYATQRTSQVYLTGMGDRNYFNMSFYRFGNLTGEVFDFDTQTYSRKLTSTAYPAIDYNYVNGKPVLGGEFSFNVNALALSTDAPRTTYGPDAVEFFKRDTSHIATDAQWRRTITDPLGQVFTPFVQGRADVYHTSAFRDQDGIGPTDIVSGPEDTFTRQLVTGGLDYRYPFVSNNGNVTQVIEPVAQIVSRAGNANNSKIPNEDARSLVFDDTLLFDINKFSGYDRVETGTRTNYGVQYTLQTMNGVSVRLVGGESLHIAGKNPYGLATGLGTDRSDYVAGGYVDYRNMFRLTSQLRLNESDFSVARQDYSVQARLGRFQGTVSYVAVEPQTTLGYFDRRQEVAGFAAFKLTDEWTLFGDARYNITEDRFIRNGVGIQYSDECFILSVTYAQTYVQYQDIKPDTQVLFKFGFKYLGQQTVSDAIGDLSPEASVFK